MFRYFIVPAQTDRNHNFRRLQQMFSFICIDKKVLPILARVLLCTMRSRKLRNRKTTLKEGLSVFDLIQIKYFYLLLIKSRLK